MSASPQEVHLQADGNSSSPAVRIRVKVVPGAKHQRIVGPHDGALKVLITQPPEGGAANRALCQLLAQTLGVATRQVQIARGQTNAWKTVRIEGVTVAQARRRLLKLE